MRPQSAAYSAYHATQANLSLVRLGLASWEPADVATLQIRVGAEPDGWLGRDTIEAWKTHIRFHGERWPHQPSVPGYAWQPGDAIIGGMGYTPPPGLRVVNLHEVNGIPCEPEDVTPRVRPVHQLIVHRGAEKVRKGETYPEATERTLDARGQSTTFSMDLDGTLYQHYDPGVSAGRLTAFHDAQSDSISIAGPYCSARHAAAPNQGEDRVIRVATAFRRIRSEPPSWRVPVPMRRWPLTAAQVTALAIFLEWYCPLRGIPLQACDSWRCFRCSDVGEADPIGEVPGILAYAQVADYGLVADGCLDLEMVRESGLAPRIAWRSGADFFHT